MQNPALTRQPSPPHLLDQVRDEIRLRHFSPSTERTYLQWARRFILFHGPVPGRDQSTPSFFPTFPKASRARST